MDLKSIIFLVILAGSLTLLFNSLKKLKSYLKLAQPDNRNDNPGKRLMHVISVAIAQSKIFRDKIAGPMHASIFWGFLVLLFSAAESVFQGLIGNFTLSFLGPVYSIITVSTDIFITAIILAIIWSLVRRFILKVKRLQGDKKEILDAMIVLLTIFIIVTSLILENAAIIKLNLNHAWSFHPIAEAISLIIPLGSANFIYELCWWIHILFILAFANYLPFSKHLHVYTSIQNVFFSPFSIPNALQKIDFEKEGVEKFGVVDIEDLSWKSLYDGYSCTHCGRCTSVCPANLTGKILDPREIIVQVRHRTIDIGPLLNNKKKTLAKNTTEETSFKFSEKEDNILNTKFVGEYESIEALWQCTTCGACMMECPICIEHVPPIIGMRRSLVMMESNFPAELQSAFSNMENNGTPWAFSSSQRADWAAGLDIKTAAEYPEFEILFWVGCAGSFDDRAIKISKAFAKLMQIAGVDFRILGTEEQCNGDPARRTGNEYLADMLVKANIETLKNYNVKKIVTICPHCFNTLKNEYPDFGGNYEVIHHSVFLQNLIAEGKLKIKQGADLSKKVAYHDSCYLGRYNNIYSAPRNTIQNIPGLELINPKRSGDKGLCCGAGGGQMFMEETVGKRVNIERTEELLSSQPDIVALNCPFCMTMLTDGVKALDKTEKVEVKDISEILLEYVEE